MDTLDKTPCRQHGTGWMRYPSGGWLLWFYKAPLLQWRLGLGPVLRRFRCIVLTTRGRKSGKARHTMLEHTVMDCVAYIAPGWGLRTQWYLNILADPRVTVQRAGKTYGAIAHRVTDDRELARLYGVTHGRSPVWKQYLDSWGVQDTVEDYVAKKNRLCVLRLDPTAEIPLPELHPDLVWKLVDFLGTEFIEEHQNAANGRKWMAAQLTSSLRKFMSGRHGPGLRPGPGRSPCGKAIVR